MDGFRLDVSDRVVRMDALEERFSISIESVYAVFQQDDFSSIVTINFDVIAANGTVGEPFDVTGSIYNENNQLISTESSYIDDESFLGIESVSQIHFNVQNPPTLIRLFPKKV